MGGASTYRTQRGGLMLEVLISIVITVIGLYGLMSVQVRLQASEVESYQRSQALLLLNDMASRITSNRNVASSYATGAGSPFGAGMTCPTSTSTRTDRDQAEWCAELQGAAETAGSSRIGAMLGARGCVEDMSGDQYMITVAWQGTVPLGTPPSSVACGQNLYDTAGSNCDNDLCRRVMTTFVRIGNLNL